MAERKGFYFLSFCGDRYLWARGAAFHGEDERREGEEEEGHEQEEDDEEETEEEPH